ncbi:hypothetical protein Peur_037735 [Populus x canadensis]
MPPTSSGLGHLSFKEAVRIRLPLGTHYLQLLEKIEDIGNFDWGVTLLAHLNCSIKKYKEHHIHSLTGNGFVLKVIGAMRSPSPPASSSSPKISQVGAERTTTACGSIFSSFIGAADGLIFTPLLSAPDVNDSLVLAIEQAPPVVDDVLVKRGKMNP